MYILLVLISTIDMKRVVFIKPLKKANLRLVQLDYSRCDSKQQISRYQSKTHI